MALNKSKKISIFLILLMIIGMFSYLLPRFFLLGYPSSVINLFSILMFVGGIGMFFND